MGDSRADPGHLQLVGPADELVAFARQHDQLVRGHTLVWHNQLPGWLTSGVSRRHISNAQLRDMLRKHITDEVTHFKGKIWQWDVVNEVVQRTRGTQPAADGINDKDFWVQHLGEGYIADAFRWARRPTRRRCCSTTTTTSSVRRRTATNDKADVVYNMVKQMLAQRRPDRRRRQPGPPRHAVRLRDAAAGRLQRYADLGLKVAITEADVRTFVDGHR